VELGTIFLSETVGTAILLLLGAGVCCAVSFNKSKAQGSGWIVINFGWGFGVFAGVIAASPSGGHLNPAVTLGLAAKNLAVGAAVDWGQVCIYIIAQFVGAFIGCILCWLCYKKQFDMDQPEGSKLGVFSTGPEVRSYGWNAVSEAVGTFVLVFIVIMSGPFGSAQGAEGPANLGWLGALGVALLIVGIGNSLGGPTGYAINPARDLGPRIFHAVWPIPNKGGNDWGYSWVPVVGPIIGGVIAGLVAVPIAAGYGFPLG
jgi:glycerol uptake facilitator protein